MKTIANRHIDLIAYRFLDNPRMKLLFDFKSYQYPAYVRYLIRYCYKIAQRLGGVFEASNKKTIMLYYRKSLFHRNLIDFFRYVRVALNIGIKNIPKIAKQEERIKQHRMDLKDYIYVWFLAQEHGYGKLDGLLEVRDHLLLLSHLYNLPILLETTNPDLIKLYSRAGFKQYEVQEIGNEKIYYFIYEV